MNRPAAWTAVLTLLLVAPVAPAQDKKLDIQKRVNELMSEVESTLGLKFKNKVEASRQTPEEFKKFLIEGIKKDMPEEKARAQTAYYRLLGLVPDDFDFTQTAVDLVASQAGAYYNPETKKIHVLMGDLSAMVMDGMLFHELVHALQDQEHDLGKTLRNLDKGKNYDKLYAYKFLVEGEASYWMQIYMLKRMGRDAPMMRQMAFGMFKNTTTNMILNLMNMQAAMSPEMKKAAEGLKKAPPILIRTMVDPYLRGMYACHQIAERKNAKHFRTLFAEIPPACTRDMMFVDDWLKEPRGVTNVRLADLGPVLGEGWKKLFADTAGAVTFHTLFEDQVAPANVVARGWNGDRLEVWTDGKKPFIAGVATFVNEAAATVFSKQLERKYREDWTQGKDIKEHEGEGLHLDAGGDHLIVRARGKDVDFCRGAVPVSAARLLEALEKSTVGGKTPSLPREF